MPVVPNGYSGLTLNNKTFAVGAGGAQRVSFEGRTQGAVETLLKADNKTVVDESFEDFNTGFAGTLQRVLTGSGSGPLSSGLAFIRDLFTLRWAQVDQHETDIAEVITRLDEVDAASPVTPAYVADINDMATCSRDDLYEYYSSGTSENPSVSMRAAKYSPPRVTFQNHSPVEYMPIVVDRAGTPTHVRWRVGTDNSLFGSSSYFVALCVYNPANGNIEKVWDSGNIVNGVAATTTLQEVAVNMSLSQQITPGQILFVAHMQIASGLAQGTRSWACKPQPGGPARPGQLLDAWYYRTPGNYTSIPSSVSLASLERRNDLIPWAAISVDTTTGGA